MVDKIITSLMNQAQRQATGRLDLKSANAQQWSVYFGMGRIVWVSGGTHPCRRWQRQLTYHCGSLEQLMEMATRLEKPPECCSYTWLSTLLEEQQIAPQQLKALIAGTVAEVLFDLLQADYKIEQKWEQGSHAEIEGFSTTWQAGVRPSDNLIIPPSWVSPTETVVKATCEVWEQWKQSGLAQWSPNWAPQLSNAQALRQQTSETTYKNLVKLLTGDRTLRDLAVQMKRDPLMIARSLTPFVRQGTVTLKEIPDLSSLTPTCATKADSPIARARDKEQGSTTAYLPSTPAISQSPPTSSAQRLSIACVDDSPLVTQTMEKILTGAGYQFVAVNDALRASATLLKSRPNLVFLDLVMPNTNGYEICALLRKVPAFRDIPIIILTGKDGIVDRVRAKLVGSSDFISKPIEAATVLAVVRKYLPAPQSVTDNLTQAS